MGHRNSFIFLYNVRQSTVHWNLLGARNAVLLLYKGVYSTLSYLPSALVSAPHYQRSRPSLLSIVKDNRPLFVSRKRLHLSKLTMTLGISYSFVFAHHRVVKLLLYYFIIFNTANPNDRGSSGVVLKHNKVS